MQFNDIGKQTLNHLRLLPKGEALSRMQFAQKACKRNKMDDDLRIYIETQWHENSDSQTELEYLDITL